MIQRSTTVELMEEHGKPSISKANPPNTQVDIQKQSCPKMTFAYQPKNELPALLLGNTPLIHRGEIFVLLASPGTGKTVLTEGLVSAHLASRNNIANVDSFGFRFHSIGRKVLLADTERTMDDCSRTYHNIYKRIGQPSTLLSEDQTEIKGIDHLVMSEIGDTKQLKKTIDGYACTGEYELIILDGILDFCLSMLDDKDATRVVKWVRSLAVKHDCAIVCTIHPNKGSTNPAGHIGAFLMRWSRAMLLIRSTTDKTIKEITADFEHAKLSHGNMSAFDPVYFGWDSSLSMMTTCGPPAPPVYKLGPLKQTIMELRLRGYNKIPTGALKEQYSKIASVSIETAKKHISKAVEDGLLTSEGRGKSIIYSPATDWKVEDGKQTETTL